MRAKVEASGRVIANFAWQHLRAATTFRDQVTTIDSENINQAFGPFFEDIRSYGSACIMSATASLEALINELFINPEGPLRKDLNSFESEFWGKNGIESKPILKKYQKALEMLGLPSLDEQSSSYRNAWALIELRNALVHYKPTWDPERQKKIELVEFLSGKYAMSPFPDAGADFVTMRNMSASSMDWVILTTVSFMEEFHISSQLESHKMSAFWNFKT